MANTTISTMLATTAMLTLAACGGGSSGITNTPTLQSVQKTITNGQSVTAPQELNSGAKLDYTNGTTGSVTTSSMSLSIPKTGLLALTYDGNTYIFTEEHAQRNEEGSITGFLIDESSINGNYVYVFGIERPIADLLDSQKQNYAFLTEYMIVRNEDISNGVVAFSVIGDKTPVSALGLFSSQTFTGGFKAELLPSQSFTGRSSRERLNGDAQISANFVNNTLQMSLQNIDYRVIEQGVTTSEQSLTGEINFTDAAIQDNTFTGNLNVSQEFLSSVNVDSLTGTYTGAFFGPNAEAVGATFSGTAERNGAGMTFRGGVEATR